MDKEPYMQAGLHQLWSVYHATKRGKEDEVSIFMLEKKLWDSKKSMSENPNMREEALGVLKKDPFNLMKLRHPAILNLIEQPAEDDKYVVFITEYVPYSLACLADNTKDHLRDKIPSPIEIKMIALELLEAINFLHQNAKQVHAGIAPENIFITKAGKIKIGGLNFSTMIGTEGDCNVPIMPMTRFNEFLMYPNLRFAAPEISNQMPKCSPSSDLYSIGALIFFLLAVEQKREPYLLS